MTITELVTATAVLSAAVSASVQLSNRSMAALSDGEQRLHLSDGLDAELLLSEAQLRDLGRAASPAPAPAPAPAAAAAAGPASGAGSPAAAASSSASASNSAGDCSQLAAMLVQQWQALATSAGVQRQAEVLAGSGGLVRIQLRANGLSVRRERLISLAGLGLCSGASSGAAGGASSAAAHSSAQPELAGLPMGLSLPVGPFLSGSLLLETTAPLLAQPRLGGRDATA